LRPGNIGVSFAFVVFFRLLNAKAAAGGPQEAASESLLCDGSYASGSAMVLICANDPPRGGFSVSAFGALPAD
jgi:hypothetical protein